MQIKDFLNYSVQTIGPDATLQEAAAKMRYLDVGSLPVCDGNRLVGMVTDRDITIRATANGEDPAATTVEAVMTPDVICCFEDQTVQEAASLMQEHQVRRLFVLNQDHDLVGITSLGDLATATGDRNMTGETLERVSDSAEFGPDRSAELAEDDDDDQLDSTGVNDLRTRITGLFDDSEQAKAAVLELKDAGFADGQLLAAMNASKAQNTFFADTQVNAALADEIPSLPELEEGQVLVLVEATDRDAIALDIINRNNGTTGGVRVPR